MFRLARKLRLSLQQSMHWHSPKTHVSLLRARFQMDLTPGLFCTVVAQLLITAPAQSPQKVISNII